MRQRIAEKRHRLAAIRATAMILQLRDTVRVLLQAPMRAKMMLTADPAAKAAELPLDHGDVLAVDFAVGDHLIDTPGFELHY
jgi:hypothetical protein